MANNQHVGLRQLRYVVEAADQGSLRRAAAALGVEESTISRNIRALEDAIGAALFIRHSAGVDLTFAGQRFTRHIRKALNQIECAARDVGAIGRAEHGTVRIGIFSSLASGFLADVLRAYGTRHAGVRVDFFEGAPSEHIASVRTYRLDIAFVTGKSELADCEVAQLWTERVFVAMPSDHPLGMLDELGWKDLRGQPFIVSEADPGPEIHDYIVKHLADLGEHPSVERHNVGRDNLMQIVALGRGLTLTSEATTAACFPGVIYRPIMGESLPFSAVWSPKNDNPALRRLLSLARAIAKKRPIGPKWDTVCERPSAPSPDPAKPDRQERKTYGDDRLQYR